MHWFIFWILFCVVRSENVVEYQLNDDEYKLMPPLVSLDPYWECLRHPGGRYCTAYANFVADSHNSLITTMQKYSELTGSRYNHTRSLFGTCLTMKCKVDEDTRSTALDQKTYLEECLNSTVWDKYKLGVKVEEKVFCHDNDEKTHVGAVDIAVACLLLVLVMCNIVGSLCDVVLPKIWIGCFSTSFAGHLLLCFSISRNWKFLIAPPGCSDPRMKQFRGFFGIRALLMIFVVSAHGMLPIFLDPENPEFNEKLYELPFMHIGLNGTLIMQTFLFLSAFLLVYILQMHTRQVTWKVLPMILLKRWLRLSLPYAVVLAVTATWLRYMGSGPIWGIMMVEESVSCSRDWWKNLLYFNNYVDDSLCMPQTWYLATDSQLFILGLVVFMSCRTSRIRKLVLSVLFLLGVVAPALHTYYQDLDGPLLGSPATAIDMLLSNRTFNEVYKRSHTNLASYVLGLAAGYCVYSWQKDKLNLDKYKKWRPLYWAMLPLGVCILLSCKLFYVSPRVPLQYRVAAAALMKPAFGILITVFSVGMIFKMEKLYRGVLEWRGWVTLGRVSYSAYLIHFGCIRLAYGTLDAPIRLSYVRMCEILVFTETIVFLAAHLFWLTVEAPLTQLVKTCLQHQPAHDTEARNKPIQEV